MFPEVGGPPSDRSHMPPPGADKSKVILAPTVPGAKKHDITARNSLFLVSVGSLEGSGCMLGKIAVFACVCAEKSRFSAGDGRMMSCFAMMSRRCRGGGKETNNFSKKEKTEEKKVTRHTLSDDCSDPSGPFAHDPS